MRELTPFPPAFPALAGAAAPHLWVLAVIAAAGLIYAKGALSLSARGAFRSILGRRAVGAFALGLLAAAAATAPPVEGLAEKLFSAHMAQHLALIMVSAPLLALGRPAQAFLWAFPKWARQRLVRSWRAPGAAPLRALLASATAIWLGFVGLFAVWHLPGPYTYALHHETAHIAEHVCLLLSAYAFWAVAFGDLALRSRGARIIFVASAALLSALPGALISIAQRPFYAVHASGAARFGLTPLEDQQLAGLVMWIPGGFLYLAVILGLLFLGLRDAERRQITRRRAQLLVLALIGAALTGCADPSAQALRRGVAGDAPGDPAKGAREIERIGCGACHTIPGIAGARGLVGPPLDHMGRRIYVAGLLRNTPEALARWVRDPQSIVPGNAMPNMGLSEEQSRDIAAYLSNIR